MNPSRYHINGKVLTYFQGLSCFASLTEGAKPGAGEFGFEAWLYQLLDELFRQVLGLSKVQFFCK